LESLREREKSLVEINFPRNAMAVICQTNEDGKPESRLCRLHYAVVKKSVEYLVMTI
jgi:hypothetical protein